MLEKAIVLIIVVIAAVYAVRTLLRNMRESGDHCSDCGLNEHKDDARRK